MATATKIVGERLPKIPWEERPAGNRDVVWRYSGNPIVGRHEIPNSNSIFNSAVVPYESGFAGVFRCDNTQMRSKLHAGWSEDGIRWKLEPKPIEFEGGDPEIHTSGGYDPRVVKIDDRFYVTWCNQYHGPTIGMAWTTDFKRFHRMENSFLPFNRNGVLFPRKVNGRYLMLSRPSDNGHTPFGEIFLSQSRDLEEWGRHRHVMRPSTGWDWLKLGAGTVPIETSEGWLMIYHGVINTCVGYLYRAGAALLDLDEPWKVRYNTKAYILSPEMDYEITGDVPNVVFPCAALCDAETGRLAIYYGGADTVVALAFTYVDELIAFIKENDVAEAWP